MSLHLKQLAYWTVKAPTDGRNLEDENLGCAGAWGLIEDEDDKAEEEEEEETSIGPCKVLSNQFLKTELGKSFASLFTIMKSFAGGDCIPMSTLPEAGTKYTSQ
ncbi:hypothetical protein SLEP1_g30572 [Rubroshorea leprosula]|uniref:Uncharacterized protein n=1 Tax=Rubroshorea leprosula TaxID=152421 RepID=A0AAV5K8Y6_9ROSI|nr:hypothetical protein SLEP1_g30572 [Rubroshorea leprosula]